MQLQKIFSAAANLQEQPGFQMHVGRGDSQMLHGEEFEVLHVRDGWAYGRSILDGYTGWINESHLAAPDPATHFVHLRSTNLFIAPDFKSRTSDTFSFLSRVTVDANIPAQNGFVKLKNDCLWIPKNHLTAVNSGDPADIVDTAMLFHGQPYQYGGRSSKGLDCSALVQLSLQRNGIFCPRDADQQEPVIGTPVTRARRGDIVYFNDGTALHVGIMIDSRNVLNATARHMAVTVEKLSDMKAHYGGIKSIRRLQP